MEEINLYDLMRFYAKKWLVILSAAILGALIGIIYTYYVQQPQYQSKATVLLIGTNRTVASQDSVILNNYTDLFTSHRVLDPVIAKESYKPGYDALYANTTAVNAKNTDIINVSISTPNARTSQTLLEDAIQEFNKQSKELYGDNSVKIKTVDAASLPSDPSNIKPVQQIGIATVGLAILSIVTLFFVYDYRHSTLQGIQKMRTTTPAPKPNANKPKATTKTAKAPKATDKTVGKTIVNLLIGDDKNN